MKFIQIYELGDRIFYSEWREIEGKMIGGKGYVIPKRTHA